MSSVPSIKARDTVIMGHKKIVSANLFSRTVAAIVDFAFVAFAGGLFYAGAQAIANATPLVQSLHSEIVSYYEDSGLYFEDDKGHLTYYEFKTYQEYETLMVNYYTDYKVNKCPEQYRSDIYDTYWYNVHIYGLNDVLNLYTPEDLSSRHSFIIEKGPTLFEYQKDNDGNVISDKLAKPTEGAKDEDLLRYYFVDQSQLNNSDYYIYLIASQDLFSTPYYNEAYNAWYMAFYTIPLGISFFLAAVIFLFVIPMITKYGRTLGKLMFHLAVVNKLGYDIKKYQIIPRFWLTALIVVFGYIVCQFFNPALMFFLGFVTIFLLISYVMMIFTGEHKAIHDYLALTLVIDSKESIWFKNIDEEEQVAKNVLATKNINKTVASELEGKDILYVNPEILEKEDIKPKDDE